jgi:outer membrane scaffolding protein for murein synthesis (MipA/OmpV family)
MESYFKIDGRNAARSGLDTHDADAGFKDVGLNVMTAFKPREPRGFMGAVKLQAAYRRRRGQPGGRR